MFPKTVFAIAALLLASAAAGPLYSTPPPPMALFRPPVVSIITLQEACARQGGLCVLVEQCEPGQKVMLPGVLCEEQRAHDVTCCYV